MPANSLIFSASARKSDFKHGIETIITRASRIGILMRVDQWSDEDREWLKEIDREAYEAFLALAEDASLSYLFRAADTPWENLLENEASGEDVTLSCTLILSSYEPGNEYEVFLYCKYIELFRIISIEINCYKARLQIQIAPDEYKILFQGDSRELRSSYNISIKPDSEPSLFLRWLQNPEEDVFSNNETGKWTPRLFEEARRRSNMGLPISYDEENEVLVLKIPNGENAAIRHSLISGRVLEVGSRADGKFHRIGDEERRDALERAFCLHSSEAVIAKYGQPDFELPPVKWKPKLGELGCQIVRQLGYTTISSRFVYLFRVWEDNLVTLMLLGKEKG